MKINREPMHSNLRQAWRDDKVTGCMPLALFKQHTQNKNDQTLVQTTDIHMQNNASCDTKSPCNQGRDESCTCTGALHMQAPVSMRYNAAPRHASDKVGDTSSNQTHLKTLLRGTVDASLCPTENSASLTLSSEVREAKDGATSPRFKQRTELRTVCHFNLLPLH